MNGSTEVTPMFDYSDTNKTDDHIITPVTAGMSTTSKAILSLVVSSTSIMTVLGNALVIYSYFTTRALRTYTNYYVLNLAVLDLIGGLFPMPMYGSYWILGYWPFSIPMCEFYLWVNHTTLNATSYAVLIIAIDRFRSIIFPIEHFQQRNLKTAIIWISFCHVLSLLIWTPAIFVWPAVNGRTFPPFICQPEYTKSIAFAFFAQLELFWIPLVIMTVLYAKIYSVFKQKIVNKKDKMPERPIEPNEFELSSNINTTSTTDTSGTTLGTTNTEAVEEAPVEMSAAQDMEQSVQKTDSRKALCSESRQVKQENRRAVRVLTFVFAVFVASGLPWAFLVIIFKKCPTCIPLALYQASVYVARFNSLLNPLCYAAANRLFMNAFKRVIFFWHRRQ